MSVSFNPALQATDLELHTKLSIMEAQISSSSNIPINFQHTDNIPENVIFHEQFLYTISQATIQKWYSIVKIVVNDFSTNAIALVDGGPDQNCISKESFLLSIVREQKNNCAVPMEKL